MRRFLLPTFFLAVAIGSARAQDSSASAPTNGRSVLKGVFTDGQAARGDNEHQSFCTSCHSTTNYVSAAFTKAWVGRTVFDLFDQLRTTMPDDSPGSLSQQQYVDIVAYILKINGFPSGTDSLSTDPEALRVIKIEAKRDSQTTFAPRSSRPVVTSPLRSTGLRPIYHPHATVSRAAR
jgi:hypothetical protein